MYSVLMSACRLLVLACCFIMLYCCATSTIGYMIRLIGCRSKSNIPSAHISKHEQICLLAMEPFSTGKIAHGIWMKMDPPSSAINHSNQRAQGSMPMCPHNTPWIAICQRQGLTPLATAKALQKMPRRNRSKWFPAAPAGRKRRPSCPIFKFVPYSKSLLTTICTIINHH